MFPVGYMPRLRIQLKIENSHCGYLILCMVWAEAEETVEHQAYNTVCVWVSMKVYNAEDV
jgi:hypothetical protein